MKLDNKISKRAAEILIDLKCVSFRPKKQFKLTSGKTSPVYCDCRKLISFPQERNELIEMGLRRIQESKNFNKINNVSGGESAGIPFATMIAEKLNLPMTYIRKVKKKFGENKQIEGILKKNDNVILVEDLITDGGSKLRFLDAICESKANTNMIFVIFNYGINTNHFVFKKKKIELVSLTNWENILEVAYKKKLLKDDDHKIIKNFLKSIGVKN